MLLAYHTLYGQLACQKRPKSETPIGRVNSPGADRRQYVARYDTNIEVIVWKRAKIEDRTAKEKRRCS